MSSLKSQYVFPYTPKEVQNVADITQITLVGLTFFGLVGVAVWFKMFFNFFGLSGIPPYAELIGWLLYITFAIIFSGVIAYLVAAISDLIGKNLPANKKTMKNWESLSSWLKEQHNIDLQHVSFTSSSQYTRFFRTYYYKGAGQEIVLTDDQDRRYKLLKASHKSDIYNIKFESSNFLLENQKIAKSNFAHENNQGKLWKEMLKQAKVKNNKLEEINVLLQKLDTVELTEAQISTIAQVIAKTNEIYVNYTKLAEATDNVTADKATDKALDKLLKILKNVQAEYVSSIEEKIGTQVNWIDTLLEKEQYSR